MTLYVTQIPYDEAMGYGKQAGCEKCCEWEGDVTMSMVPMRKKCRVCGRWYAWNPDVGGMVCPYCTGKRLKEIVKEVFGK